MSIERRLNNRTITLSDRRVLTIREEIVECFSALWPTRSPVYKEVFILGFELDGEDLSRDEVNELLRQEQQKVKT